MSVCSVDTTCNNACRGMGTFLDAKHFYDQPTIYNTTLTKRKRMRERERDIDRQREIDRERERTREILKI